MKNYNLYDVLSSEGFRGKFKNLYYISLCSAVMFSVFPEMSYVLVARDIKYRCKIKSCNLEDGSFTPEWLKSAVPFRNNIPEKCIYYAPKINNTCIDFQQSVTNVCQDFVYERMETTIVHDFKIHCEEELWKLTLVGTINLLANVICTIFAGYYCDKRSPKFVVLLCLSFSTILGIVKSFSISYGMFLIFEFLNAGFAAGIYNSVFMIAMDLVDKKEKNLCTIILSMACTVAHILLGVVGWITPSWRVLVWSLHLSGFLVILLFCFQPESPKWLAKNRANPDELTDELIDDILPTKHKSKKRDDQKNSILVILKDKKLLIRLIHCSFTWICCEFPYYGLTIQSVNLSEDIYLNLIYVSLAEIPAHILSFFVIEKFGRRLTLAVSLMLTGVACIAADFLHYNHSYKLILFITGKMFITISCVAIDVLTAELFPTEISNTTFSICSMFGGIGTMLAPQIPLLTNFYRPLPLLMFAGISLAAGVLAVFFPKSRDEE